MDENGTTEMAETSDINPTLDNSELRHLRGFVDFVNLWCLRDRRHLTDADAISVIKHHPVASDRREQDPCAAATQDNPEHAPEELWSDPKTLSAHVDILELGGEGIIPTGIAGYRIGKLIAPSEPESPEARLTLFQELEKERQAGLRLLARVDSAFGILCERGHLDRHDHRLWEDLREFIRDVP